MANPTWPILTTILVCVTNGENVYLTLEVDDVLSGYWKILYSFLFDGRTVYPLLTAAQKNYLMAQLTLGTASIDLVLMP